MAGWPIASAGCEFRDIGITRAARAAAGRCRSACRWRFRPASGCRHGPRRSRGR